MAKLSVVATPIGNLEDITLRALRILKEADVVACEDTRVTKKLLSHFNIHTPVVTLQKIPNLLSQDKHVALVSDAGTPGVSDPGLEIVSHIREQNFSKENGLASPRPSGKNGRDEEIRGPFRRKNSEDVQIETIPGPSALAAALAIAGLRAPTFTFYGFLPLKKGRETLFKEIALSERASIFYESPHRILKALESLKKVLPENRRVGLYRELTKIYEEAIVGSASEVLSALKADSNKQRGEFVVVVEAVK